MPDAAWAVSGIRQADPEGMATPRFWHRLIRFRHVISGLLALASLNLACRNLVPAFPQRSPPSLLTTAACGGLRPEPDCRSRRALLHLSYSYAPSYSDDARDTRHLASIRAGASNVRFRGPSRHCSTGAEHVRAGHPVQMPSD